MQVEFKKPEVLKIKENPFKICEYCARVCYHSEDLITETSYKKLLKHCAERNHLSIFEHARFHLILHETDFNNLIFLVESESLKQIGRPYKLKGVIEAKEEDKERQMILEVNGRSLLQWECLQWVGYQVYCKFGLEEIVKHLKDVKTFMQKPCSVDVDSVDCYTFKIVTNRYTADQIIRHRCFTFSMQSLRYVNFSKDKFGDSIPVVLPETKKGDKWFRKQCETSVDYYDINLLFEKPEVARHILPLSVGTILMVTGNKKEFKEFIKLRKDSHAQLDIQVIAEKIEDLIQKNVGEEING